jgi:uncharacterized SAM-binding protein YcdF (DUF218 family)
MRTALIVLGHSEPGGFGLSHSGVARVHRACALARKRPPEFVILSGWGREGAPQPEAELMAEAWDVPGTLLIRDPFARDTAENALFARQILDGHGEVDELTVVTSGWHAPRARMFFKVAFRGSPVKLHVVAADEDGYRLGELLHDIRRLKYARGGLREARARVAAGGLAWEASPAQ